MILAAKRGDQVRVARLTGDELIDFCLWNRAAPDGVGDIYHGRVLAVMPAMAGSFIELGGIEGFLPNNAGRAKLSVGDLIAVRVTRAAQGGKGVRLAWIADAPGSKPGLRERGPGPLLEWAAAAPDEQVRVDDSELLALWHQALGPRLSLVAQAFDPILDDEVAGLAEPIAALPGGARMIITPTPALTAIDIDAGAHSASKSQKAVAQLALNRDLIPFIARQIRLRNLSGGILIDFAGMKTAARARLAPDVRAALADDPLKPALLGFSHLGFAEILRPRIRPPLHEVLRHGV